MPLSQEAIENDQRCGLPLVPVKKIYSDSNFNCRGTFSALDVIELIRDIEKRGLVEPIIVRKLWDNEKAISNQGYEYSLVAGFRRHFAYRSVGAEYIPAIVRVINSDFECRDINAVENLQRLDLNILQETMSIRHYIIAGWTRQQIAERVSKSPGWVQARCELLEMPEQIQQAAAQGYLKQEDLKLLYKKRNNRNEMLRLAGIIAGKRKSGEKKDILSKVPMKKKPLEKKIRKPGEVFNMMETVRDICKHAKRDKQLLVEDLFSEQGNSIITRLLAWSMGDATNIEAYNGLQKLAGLLEVSFDMPEFDREP